MKNLTASTDLSIRRVKFRSPILQGWEWTVHDISAREPGPRLCVMAGIHVNEVSSIEAAFQLVERFRRELRRGTVSIMPIANPPALPYRSEYVCPIDGKNINFCFPGSSSGTFSEALADGILNEWAADADCLIDLHGGDLCESVARFTVVPTIGDPEFDEFNLALSTAFEPDIIVRLDPDQLAMPGRSCSGRARQRKNAVFAEAGNNGLIDDHSVKFHRDGVLRVAALLGMMDGECLPPKKQPIVADQYHWIQSGVDGWCRYAVEPGEKVVRGQLLATIDDYSGNVIREVLAPTEGHLLWRCTHAVVTSKTDLFGIAGTRDRSR
ncbi:succinylglutamate desuccinylase/aspartoacylase family protein [Brevibacillus massiliensis]|uniref:succinylglutamate desuccinylase/aspartoacylase family protein n=1 Tax=Brevibacillus massiliensis TaxID=1118054 RepID=UPI00137624CB|nr:succinylglutamate desuccinylase/aspartoacylase family protein [Brevibacillus massiliensis]